MDCRSPGRPVMRQLGLPCAPALRMMCGAKSENAMRWLLVFFAAVSFVFAVLVIYDVWTNNKKETQEMKIVWTILAVLFGIVTGIVYYFLRKRN